MLQQRLRSAAPHPLKAFSKQELSYRLNQSIRGVYDVRCSQHFCTMIMYSPLGPELLGAEVVGHLLGAGAEQHPLACAGIHTQDIPPAVCKTLSQGTGVQTPPRHPLLFNPASPEKSPTFDWVLFQCQTVPPLRSLWPLPHVSLMDTSPTQTLSIHTRNISPT